MLKRDTRVQIVILQDGKYLLLKHYAKKENMYFWALPGGGREKGESEEETAIREAFEETGMKIKLLPIKLEDTPHIENSIYNRIVTFVAYPVEGEAKVGYDPEPEMRELYEIVDLRWQDFNNDNGVDEITLKDIVPIRHKFNEDKKLGLF